MANDIKNQPRPALTLDVEQYEKFLEDSDLTEDQKREFLETLWNIVVEFVSLGFGVHPVQQAQNACGKGDEKTTKPALTAPGAVESRKSSITENFTNAAQPEKKAAGKGGR